MNINSKVKTMNKELLAQVKQGFVPMPGGQTEPVAGAGMMTAAQAAPMGPPPGAPMDPSMAGGDPAAMGGAPMDPSMAGGAPMDPSMMGGAPMDPSMMGGAPMDPSMMGGAPMDPSMMGGAPMDPSMMGGDPGAAADGTITMPVSQLLELISVLTSGSVEKAKHESAAKSGEGPEDGSPAQPKKPNQSQMIKEIYQALLQGGQPQM